ncbi:MAG: hypothetical protein Q9193_003316 [Seirophora villosa]
MQRVKCTKCSLNDPSNIEAHLEHQHKEVKLPHPMHHCPECGGPAPHQLKWVSTSNSDELQSEEATTAFFNRAEVIEVQLEKDVYEKESPWMNDDLFIEDPSAKQLRGDILMDLYRNELHAEDLERALNQTFRRPAPQPSRPLTASATPFQPGVPWVASQQHQQQRGGPRGQDRGQRNAQRGRHQQQPPRSRGASQRGIHPGQPSQQLPPLVEESTGELEEGEIDQRAGPVQQAGHVHQPGRGRGPPRGRDGTRGRGGGRGRRGRGRGQQ